MSQLKDSEHLKIIRNKMFNGMYDHLPEKGCSAVTDDVMGEIDRLLKAQTQQLIDEILSELSVELVTILGDLAQECEQYGATPEQFGSPPNINQAIDKVTAILEKKKEDL